MTQDDIIRMARDAGLICESRPVTAWMECTDLTPYLTRFAALIATNEREACAKVCDETKAPKIRDEWSAGQTTGCSSCAAAIRARGEK